MARPKTYDVKVRFTGGAYVTSTVRVHRSSCTHSAEEAATRLGRKIFGHGFERVEALPVAGDHSISHYRLHGDAEAMHVL